MELKVYNYSDATEIGLNYKGILSKNLYYDEVIKDGLISKELYYSDEALSDLVIEVSISYEIDATTKIVSKIEKTIKYLSSDGGEDLVLSRKKKLVPRQQMKLLKNRRKTIRHFAEAVILKVMIATLPDNSIEEIMSLGGKFLLDHNEALDHFEKVGSPRILAELNSATDSWLDNSHALLGGATIRQYLLSQFS